MIVEHLTMVQDTAASVMDAVSRWAAQPDPTPSPGDAPVVNTDGIIDFIITKIVPILLAAIGVVFISRAGKGEMSRVLTSSAIAFIGIGFIVGAVAFLAFGRSLVTLIFGATPEP